MAVDYDVVIVGGGIAGGALATVLARTGLGVLMLERQEQYRDQVRGEYMAPWGVPVAQRLGLLDVLTGDSTRACFQRTAIFYDENSSPAEAEAAPLDMSVFVPGVAGSMDLGHPETCEALAQSAAAAGADVRRGVTNIVVEAGTAPSVVFVHERLEHRLAPRLVVGTDGRNSSVRNQLGLTLHQDPAPTMASGLLVEGLEDWPQDTFGRGTCGRVSYFLFPQTKGRTRLYLQYPAEDAGRFNGPDREQAFLDAFSLPCLPQPERFPALRPVGPCVGYRWNSTWTDTVLAAGVVLVGDAGGYNDPVIGQGLSLSLSDVADLSEVLAAESAWTPATFTGYEKRRSVRMERARACALLISAIFAEFGPQAAARRAVAVQRMLTDETCALPFVAHIAGYDVVPEYAYSDELRHRILAAA